MASRDALRGSGWRFHGRHPLRIIGVDPGKTGAAALIRVDSLPFGSRPIIRTIDIFDFIVTAENEIDVLSFRDWLTSHRADHVCFEQVHAMPRDGKVQAYSFGQSVGILKATVRLSGYKPEFVIPQVWKRRFDLINQPKDAARLRAIKLMPDAAKWLQRMRDIGRADSLLIAMYGAEKKLGQQRVAAMLAEEMNGLEPQAAAV